MQEHIEKILLEPEKPNSVLEIFLVHEDLALKSNLGRLFVMVEIDSREKGLKEKVRQLTEMIQNDYYASAVSDVEGSLENTCQNININLPEIFAKPELWYKKLNILVGITKDDLVAVSSFGEFSGYLMRNRKITQILKSEAVDLEEGSFFSQLVTGDVKAGDVIIFSNYALFDFFSLEKIRDLVVKLKPQQAKEQLRNLLIEDGGVPNVLSLLIKYEEEIVRVEESADEETKKYLQDLYGSEESMNQLENLEQRTGRMLMPTVSLNLKKMFSLKGKQKKDLKLPKAEIREKKGKFLFGGLWRLKVSPKEMNKDDLKEKKVVKSKNWFNKNTAVVIGVVVVVFVGSLIFLSWRQGINEKNAKFEGILVQAEENQSEAEAALIYQDSEKANNLLEEALKLLGDVPANEEKWYAQAISKKKEINKLINKIHNVFEVDLEKTVALEAVESEGVLDMVWNDNKLYVLGKSGSVYEINPEDKSLKQKFVLSGGKQLTVWDDESVSDAYILFDSDQKFYYHKGENEDELNVVVPEEKQIADLEVYGEKIYYLDNEAAAIYKVSQPLAVNPNITVWTQNESEVLKEASQMVIDGNIWLVAKSEIVKMFRGDRQDFKISKLDKNLSDDLIVASPEDSNYLYILDKDNKRLVVIDKEGVAQRQFVNEELGQAENLIVGVDEKIAWVTVGTEVKEISLVIE